MSERKALLILHGKQALNEDVRVAVEDKRREGWELAVRLTWEAGDAQRLVQEALAMGYRQLRDRQRFRARRRRAAGTGRSVAAVGRPGPAHRPGRGGGTGIFEHGHGRFWQSGDGQYV